MGNKEEREREYRAKKAAAKGKKSNQAQKKRLPCENGRHRDSEFPCMKTNC